MKIKIFYDKSVEENAEIYFEKSKKIKKKIESLKKKIQEFKERLNKIKEKEKGNLIKIKKNKQWYHKFRWFFTSNNLLVVAGRDATSNEVLIKKYTEKNDLVLHTEIKGSPFTVIKSNNKEIDEKSIEEAAIFTASFSRAWKEGLAILEVFYVKPEQVSKKAPSGEYLTKGSFMIYGKKNFIKVPLQLYCGIYKGFFMIGPKSAIEKHCEKYVKIIQGNKKISDIAKKLKKILNYDDLDEIIRNLPQGCDIDLKDSKL